MTIKKIAVCHGPTCGPNGAARIKKTLESHLTDGTIEITARECCGRCKINNSIVIDDTVTISNLTLETITSHFLADPAAAIKLAKENDAVIAKQLDELLDADLLSIG